MLVHSGLPVCRTLLYMALKSKRRTTIKDLLFAFLQSLRKLQRWLQRSGRGTSPHQPHQYFFKRKENRKKKREAISSGGRGWTDKVFGLKILPVGWRFFIQNLQGLTLADQSEGLCGARLLLLASSCFFSFKKIIQTQYQRHLGRLEWRNRGDISTTSNVCWPRITLKRAFKGLKLKESQIKSKWLVNCSLIFQ